MPSVAYSLPPTTNDIPSSQRSQLIRSARKLGSILGTTPHLVEDCSSDDAASIISTSSRRGANGKSNKKRFQTPPTLLLPVNALPVPHSSLPSPLLPSPTTPDFSAPSTPMPTQAAPYSRRRQLAKLSRTLGENVPPELVFGYPPSQFAPPPAPMTPSSTSLRRRGTSISVSATNASVAGGQTRSHRRPSFDVAAIVPKDMPFYNAARKSSASRVDVNAYEEIPSKREEREWEGAWNMESMGEVRNKLRALKA